MLLKSIHLNGHTSVFYPHESTAQWLSFKWSLKIVLFTNLKVGLALSLQLKERGKIVLTVLAWATQELTESLAVLFKNSYTLAGCLLGKMRC